MTDQLAQVSRPGPQLPAMWQIVQYWASRDTFPIDFERPHCFGCGVRAPRAMGSLTPEMRWGRAGLEKGHLVNRARYGLDAVQNLVPLCYLCNFTMPIFDSPAAPGPIEWVQAGGWTQYETAAEKALLGGIRPDARSQTWKAIHAGRHARGLPSSGGRRFGYTRTGAADDERYIPHPEEARVLASLYERYAAGEAPRSLLHWLNDAGIRTATGSRWVNDTLLQVLTSGFAAGLLRVHDPACSCGGPRGDAQCTRRVYIEGAHEPVITSELWDAFLARQEARVQTPPRLRDPVHPFSGLLYCGDRDHRLRAATGRGAVFYHCAQAGEGRGCPGAYVREAQAEETVLGMARPAGRRR